MRIVLQDMESNIIKEISDISKYEIFTHSPKVKSVEYDENFKIFDKLNQDLIVLRYCKNSQDFIVEYISQNHIDLINSIYVDEYEFVLDYSNVIGRYFSKLFPFLRENKLLKIFNDVAINKEPYEFREVKYIDDILISIYRHKLFFLEDKLFHLSYFEEDLDLLYFAGEEFFNNSERPYILIEGNEILKVNDKFLDYFSIEESEILGLYDFANLNLIDINHDELDMILNNLLNRKSFFETFEFSIIDSKDKRRWLRAFASPSSHNYNPAVKIFFKEITDEKEYELEAYLLRDTLNLVQYENDIAGFYKKKSKQKNYLNDSEERYDEEFLEESIMNNDIKNMEKEQVLKDDIYDDLKKGSVDSFDIFSQLDKSTVFSKGIYNILDLSSGDFNHIISFADFDEESDSVLAISGDSDDSEDVLATGGDSDDSEDVLATGPDSDDSEDVLAIGGDSDDSKYVFSIGGDSDDSEDVFSIREEDYEDDSIEREDLSRINDYVLEDSDNLSEIEFSKYISDSDKENFKSELNNFSKNYDTINTNFRIITEKNREKYINFIMEGEFNENGVNLDYIGFLKDNTDRILIENKLKENLTKMDLLLNEITDINQKLEKTKKSEEKLLNDSHVLIKDLFYIFINIMDYSLNSGLDKTSILENFQRRINVLLLIHRYIGKDFDLLNISLKVYINEVLDYLSKDENLKLNYKLNLEDIHINIGSLTFLGIILYEFVYNIFADDEILISLKKKNGSASLTIKKENESESKGGFNVNLVEEILDSLDFKLFKSENGDCYSISIPIVNEYIVSLNN
ncbi:MAG: hypothetical protein E7Z75_02970 [Methanobrevibacter olleyae]|uniref:Signal transduction histidine kinase n=1 Tax=Methanobrevibacter olleyae TaxID=294671 RepID=A0A8T3VLJ1_METOL|nr:hypothetical protein [Methanobrevibacter olleyae]